MQAYIVIEQLRGIQFKLYCDGKNLERLIQAYIVID